MEKRNFHCIRLPSKLNKSLQKPWNMKKYVLISFWFLQFFFTELSISLKKASLRP